MENQFCPHEIKDLYLYVMSEVDGGSNLDVADVCVITKNSALIHTYLTTEATQPGNKVSVDINIEQILRIWHIKPGKMSGELIMKQQWSSYEPLSKEQRPLVQCWLDIDLTR